MVLVSSQFQLGLIFIPSNSTCPPQGFNQHILYFPHTQVFLFHAMSFWCSCPKIFSSKSNEFTQLLQLLGNSTHVSITLLLHPREINRYGECNSLACSVVACLILIVLMGAQMQFLTAHLGGLLKHSGPFFFHKTFYHCIVRIVS